MSSPWRRIRVMAPSQCPLPPAARATAAPGCAGCPCRRGPAARASRCGGAGHVRRLVAAAVPAGGCRVHCNLCHVDVTTEGAGRSLLDLGARTRSAVQPDHYVCTFHRASDAVLDYLAVLTLGCPRSTASDLALASRCRTWVCCAERQRCTHGGRVEGGHATCMANRNPPRRAR